MTVTILEPFTHMAGAHAYAMAAIALAAAIAFAFAIRTLRRRSTTRPPAAVFVAAIAAAACTAYSADTSWRFARDHLGMTSVGERGMMFAAAELGLFSMALMARQNLNTTDTPGTPGMLVWVITGVQVIPAFSESGLIGGFVRAFVGPVLAALLWHLAMGIELRHHKPDANSQALLSVVGRELRERLMSRLGLTVRDRTAEQITRDRWTVKAVALAARLSDMAPAKRDSWRGRRLARHLSVAVGKALSGAPAEQRLMLLELLAARRHSASLATIDLSSPWVPSTGDGVPLADAEPSVVTICPGPGGLLSVDTADAPVATEPPLIPPPTVDPGPATDGDTTATTGDDNSRQEPPAPAATTPAKTTPVKRQSRIRSGASKKAPRRSLDEWVVLAGPVFHTEFARLRRNPTANEFATAIGQAGLGLVSDSTAKNIRAEILDRTELPSLDGEI